MKRKSLKAIAPLISVLILILAAAGEARAQGSPILYSIDEYLMADRNAEIVVNRSWMSLFNRPKVMLTSQFKDAPPRYVFIVPVGRWSDGAPTPVM